MKTKIVISAIWAGIACAEDAYGLALVDPDNCIECRPILSSLDGNTVHGECSMYDATCCDPCKKEVVPIDPTISDETTCSGSTIITLDGNCEKVDTKGCKNNACIKKTSLRCVKGYYGTAEYEQLNLTKCTGCEPCPTSGGIAGTTSGPGATAITECYLPSGTSFSDSTGSGIYVGDCYYKN